MKIAALEEKKKRLEEERARLQRKEKRLKEAERKKRISHLIGLGTLIKKAQIDEVDIETLMGALLEIKSNLSNPDYQRQWKSKGTNFLRAADPQLLQRLVIKFKQPPSMLDRAILKKFKFRWNSFRGEWHGFGEIESISKAIDITNATIEPIHE